MDNFKFTVHELFLYALAVFVDHGQYSLADYLIRTPYFMSGAINYGEARMKTFEEFYLYTKICYDQDEHYAAREYDRRANLIKERGAGTDVDFRKIMQADFILFMRSWLFGEKFSHWYPVTLVHSIYERSPFEVFARAMSKSVFDEIKILLSIDKPADLESAFEKLRETPYRGPRWGPYTVPVETLLGFDKLATRP